ncbi:MAG: TatD family hydrolase [Fimbriimonadaceae bacterium]
MTLVDTHCHLADRRAFPEPRQAIEEALEAGVRRMVTIGIDTETSLAAMNLAEAHEEVYAAAGWHPNHASDYRPTELAPLAEMLGHPKCVALGEIGLDYYRDHATPDEQEKAFRDQLDLALEHDKPVVIHCREAYEELLSILESRPVPRLVFHCFSGTESDARRALALGGWLGVDGPVTYKRADELRAVLAAVPLEKLLIETDAPYMPPEPHRGKPNRPAWVALVNEGLAQALETSAEETAGATTKNAISVFGPMGL